ncbi:MAG: nuclear transport factor 2 family protein [Flavobacteriales bacterium]|nr:nuclear transport factor 2 family protein [Flavobacteriales bacterium]
MLQAGNSTYVIVVAAGLILFTCMMTGCGPRFTSTDREAIKSVMQAQEVAWNAGDLAGFMAGYVDTVCFIGRSGLTCGREAVTANYRKGYPDRVAMGRLSFGVTELLPVDAHHAWLTGTWRLERTADTLAGGFTLLWTKGGEGWRIARDHSH